MNLELFIRNTETQNLYGVVGVIETTEQLIEHTKTLFFFDFNNNLICNSKNIEFEKSNYIEEDLEESEIGELLMLSIWNKSTMDSLQILIRKPQIPLNKKNKYTYIISGVLQTIKPIMGEKFYNIEVGSKFKENNQYPIVTQGKTYDMVFKDRPWGIENKWQYQSTLSISKINFLNALKIIALKKHKGEILNEKELKIYKEGIQYHPYYKDEKFLNYLLESYNTNDNPFKPILIKQQHNNRKKITNKKPINKGQ